MRRKDKNTNFIAWQEEPTLMHVPVQIRLSVKIPNLDIFSGIEDVGVDLDHLARDLAGDEWVNDNDLIGILEVHCIILERSKFSKCQISDASATDNSVSR